MKIVILGSGVIGTTAAYYLGKAGHDVTVLERQPGPALETSYANAGEVSPGYAAPWAGPGVPVKAIKWLLMHHRPLVVKPMFDLAMWRWGAQMLRNCTAARYALNKGRMVRLAEYSRDCLKQLRADTGIRYDERAQGTLQLFRTQKQLDGTAKDIEVLQQYGVPYQLLDRDGYLQYEPALAEVKHKFVIGDVSPAPLNYNGADQSSAVSSNFHVYGDGTLGSVVVTCTTAPFPARNVRVGNYAITCSGTGTPDPANAGALAYTHTVCPQASLSAVTPCPPNQIGEVNAKIGALLPAGEPAFDIHFDDAPAFYVNGQPNRTDTALRKLERDVGAAQAPDPYAGAVVPITQRLADTVEEKTLHMVNADPKRTPSFTMFGDADFFFQTTNLAAACGGASVCVNPAFAWNHGDFQDEIANTWVGFVGPGVSTNGVDSTTWTDHVDVRPTINSILGLSDSNSPASPYLDDGRVISEILGKSSRGHEHDNGKDNEHEHRNSTQQLGAAYKQVNAPFGSFALDTLVASTNALKQPATPTGDLNYDAIETQIANLTTERDVLAGAIRAALNDAAAGNGKIDEDQARTWVKQARSLLDRAHALAAANPA